MIVDVYQLLVTDSGGHQETYELRVQSDTSPTLVAVISDAWLDRNCRKHVQSSIENRSLRNPNKPHSYLYSELAAYETRQSIAQQGFCIRLSDSLGSILHLHKDENLSDQRAS